MERKTMASTRLVDLWIEGDDQKKFYKHINDKLEMIVNCYDPNKKEVFVENIWVKQAFDLTVASWFILFTGEQLYRI